jgi:DNA-binding transcriptional regulator YiaG
MVDRIEIHENRIRLGLSQAALSRRANLNRFKLHTCEAGGGSPERQRA